ncbi:hypothetical protein PG994_013094 [Apiospora phragmitis]|uniref:Carrier domain-containing protein n=1 Tax=Apiospora phragmitis TaxID=2905665 RepID=A0ABR1T7N5_9PEZI
MAISGNDCTFCCLQHGSRYRHDSILSLCLSTATFFDAVVVNEIARSYSLMEGPSDPKANTGAVPHAVSFSDGGMSSAELLDVDVDEYRIDSSCDEYNSTCQTWVRAAWAILLRKLDRSDTVLFQETLVKDGNTQSIGDGETFISVVLEEEAKIPDVFRLVQAGNQPMSHQGPETKHEVPLLRFWHLVQDEDAPAEAQQYHTGAEHVKTATMILDAFRYKNRLSLRTYGGRSNLGKIDATHVVSMFKTIIHYLLQGSKLKLSEMDLWNSVSFESVEKWNKHPPSKVDLCVHTMIAQQFQLQPSAPAVCAWDGELSYSELDLLSNALASRLAGLGVGPETFVPVFLPKSKWTPVAMTAIMRAGGAFVLLEPSHPIGRLQEMCLSLQASLVVTLGRLSPTARALAPTVFELDMEPMSLASTALQHPNETRPQNSVYAVFTSGSTGKPKAVVIEHTSFASSARAHIGPLRLSPSSRVFQFSSYAFDVSIADHLSTLIAGGCICIPSEEDRSDILRAMVQLQVNWAHLTPSVLSLLSPEAVPGLQTLVLIGEPMSEKDVRTWYSRVHMISAYGPAECSVVSTVQDLVSFDAPGNIGCGTGARCWVVDPADTHKLLPVGLVGELLLEGPILAREYLNDPEKSAASFVSDLRWAIQSSCAPLGRMLHTCKDEADSYLFVLKLHHAVYDGWSLPLVLNQVWSAYNGSTACSRPFTPFIEHVQHSRKSRSRDFWMAYFQDFDAQIFPGLPHGASTPLPSLSLEKSVHLSSQSFVGVTLSTILELSWAITLGQHTASNNVVFGLVVSGRSAMVDGISDMTGPTIATVPIRILLDSLSSVESQLREVQRNSVEMIPFEQTALQYIAQFGTDCQTACQFQNLLVIQPRQETETPALFCDQVSKGVDFNTYGLTMLCHPETSSLRLEARFDPDMVAVNTVQRMLELFSLVIKQVARDSEKMLRDLQLITGEDMACLEKWNTTSSPRQDALIHHLISQRRHESPEAPAVDAWDGSLTYAELDDLSSRLAVQLTSYDIGPESFVLLLFDKSLWTTVAMLGVMKAGGAFVLLDPSHPQAELEEISRAVEGNLVICSAENHSTGSILAATVVVIGGGDDDDSIRTGAGAAFGYSNPAVTPRNAAYVAFTSGSTGRPKGVVIEHASFCTSAIAHGTAMSMGKSSRVLQFAAYAFDVSVSDNLTTLIFGGCICVPSEMQHRNNLAATACEMKVSWANLTPSTSRILHPRDVLTLKTLVLSGESMSKKDIETWSPALHLAGSYGPAECSVKCLVRGRITAGSDPYNLGNTTGGTCWIVQRNDPCALVPIGCVGDILVEAPDWITKFRHDRDPGRVYLTGDLAQYCSDGTVHYIGRKDTQVKLRGQRIELQEVEHHLSQTVEDWKAVVAEVVTPPGREYPVLVAFISQDRPERANYLALMDGVNHGIFIIFDDNMREQIRQAEVRLTQVVPGYMIPSLFIFLESLPLTKSGKADRRRLRKALGALSREAVSKYSSSARQTRSPATSDEALLREVFSTVLNLPLTSIGVDDNFFHIGGDSITAIQLVTACRARNVTVTVQDIFRQKTIALMVSHLSHQPDSRYKAKLENKEDHMPSPLSPIQQLFFQTAPRGQNHYCQSFFLGLSRPVMEKELRNAIEHLLHRHDMLRARFQMNASGSWEQTSNDDIGSSYVLSSHDLRSREQVFPIAMAAQKSMDISQGPVSAAALLSIEGDGCYLYMVAHHLIIDLVSWRILLGQLDVLLRGGLLPPYRSSTFETWCKLSKEYSEEHLSPSKAFPSKIALIDSDYWGMKNRPNLHRDVEHVEFSFNKSESSALLGRCNQAFRTQPVEIATDDRASFPAILKQVKDGRRLIPRNGWSYFNSRHFNSKGRGQFGPHFPVEILFNYEGIYQQLERGDSLLQHIDWSPRGVADAAEDMDRFALIVVTTTVVHSTIKFSFAYNRYMRQGSELLRNWEYNCKTVLEDAASSLPHIQPLLTLSDFPLLPVTYDELDELVSDELPRHQVTTIPNCIQDIYPCSPMQQGVQVSQSRDPSLYQLQTTWEVVPTDGKSPIQLHLLQAAWNSIVKRHDILRTVLIRGQNHGYPSSFQVVLAQHAPRIRMLEHIPDNELASVAEGQLGFEEGQPPHSLTLCQTYSGKTVIIFKISHALIDGSSTWNLLQELSYGYGSELPGRPTCPYSAYISYLADYPIAPSLDYWRDYLSNMLPCHFPSLRDDFVKTGRTRRYQYMPLHFRKSAEYQGFCRRMGVTIANLFQLAWALVLRLYTGMDSVCFGYILSGRDIPLPHIESAIGPFINMLVSRLDLKPASSMASLLRNCQYDYGLSLPYQHCTIAEITQAIGVDGPLFNTVMSLQHLVPRDESIVPQIKFRCIDRHEPMEYAIGVHIYVHGTSTEGSLRFWDDELSWDNAKALASVFDESLSMVVANPGRDVHDLQPWGHLRDAEVYAPVATSKARVEDLIVERCREKPSAPAVCEWDGDFTYSQLNCLSSKLASHLISQRIRPESFVPILMEKSRLVTVAIVGVVKSGAGFLLLDPSYPISRLREMCKAVGARSFISLTSLSVASTLAGALHLTPGNDETAWRAGTPESARLVLHPENALYAVFTSGSTGAPKIVVVEHRAFASSTIANIPALNISSSTRAFQFSSHAFDVSVSDHLFTLIAGGCICISLGIRVNRGHCRCHQQIGCKLGTPNPVCTEAVAESSGFTRSQDPGSDWRAHVKTGYSPMVGRDKTDMFVRTSRVLRCDSSATRHFSGFPPRNIGHATAATCWVVDPTNPEWLVPPGAVGELLIEGPILARGYLNDEEKTAASFLDNVPWLVKIRHHPDSLPRLYRSGDLVRRNLDGSLTFIGRKDTQVKIRGQRVELGEIETHVHQCLPTATAVLVDTLSLPQGSEESQILACFVLPDYGRMPENGANQFTEYSELFLADIALVESQLADNLPAHMLPAIYIPLSFLPTTQSGKTDRERIRLEAGRLYGDIVKSYDLAVSGHQQRPTSGHESTLLKLMAKVLKLAPTLLHQVSNFFRLGGESIKAIELCALVRDNGMGLLIADVFRHPTVSQLAPKVRLIGNGAPHEAPCPFSLMADLDSLESLIELAALSCGVPVPLLPYVKQILFDVGENVEIELLQAAWIAVANANAILRTRLVHFEEYGTFQVVLDHIATWETYRTEQEYFNDALQTQIDFGDPLMRLNTVGDSSEKGRRLIAITLHHAVYDSWTLPLIFNQVQMAYSGARLPLRPFSPYIEFQCQPCLGANDFWKNQLAGLETEHFPSMPTPEIMPKPGTSRGKYCSLPQTRESMYTVSTQIRLAWALLLSQYTGSEDVVFGTTVSGRQVPIRGIENLTGPTISTVPLRVKLQSSDSVEENLRRLRTLSSEAFEACQFQNLLVVQPRAAPTTFSGLLHEVTGQATSPTAAFGSVPLTLVCELDDSGVHFEAIFDEGILDGTQVDYVLHQLCHVLQQIYLRPAACLSQVDFLDAPTWKFLKQWNGTLPEATRKCAHDLILEQCVRRPVATAITAWDGELTYGELDDLSIKFVAQLSALDSIGLTYISIYSEKSKWVTVAMLAVLRIGKAFVLLDPSHPTERLSSICRQINAKHVISSARLASLAHELASKVTVIGDRLSSCGHLASELPRVDPDQPIYAVFTSGTTGRPKGVIISHSSYCTSATAHIKAFSLHSGSRVLQFASYSFDASIVEIVSTLLAGGCVCVPSEDERYNLAELVSQYRVNWLHLTPTVAQLLDPCVVPSTSTLVLVGEAMTEANVALWAHHVSLICAHGPAEYSICSTVETGILPGADSCIIGRACGGGDLVQYHPSGSIRYIGRKDAQVKLRGQRIEPTEIELKVSKCFPGARDVLVDVLYPAGPVPDPILGAFIQLNNARLARNQANPQDTRETESPFARVSHEFQHNSAAARETLQNILPTFMIPTRFFQVTHMPFTLSGKRDRAKLKSITSAWPPSVWNKYRAVESTKGQPSSASEIHLQEMVGQVLGLEPENVDMDSTFFRVGGDSIKAMKLGVGPKAPGVAEAEAPISIFGLLGSDECRASVVAAALEHCQISAEQVEDIYPCTPLQEGLMALALKEPGKFVARFVYRLPPWIELPRFREAWELSAAANPILRSRIMQHESGGTYQVVVRERLDWQLKNSHETFTLGDRMCHLLITETTDGFIQFVLRLHHALYDGWSLALLLAQVEKAYGGLRPKLRDSRPFIRFTLQNNNDATTESFWRSRLAGYDPRVFPVVPSLKYQVAVNDTLDLSVPMRAGTLQDSTPSVLFYAVFGLTVMGRNAPRVQINPEKKIREMLQTIQEQYALAIPFEHTGLQNIRRFSTDAQLACSFQNMLVIQADYSHENNQGSKIFEESSEEAHVHGAFDIYPLTALCTLGRDCIQVQIRFDDHLLTQRQAQGIIHHLSYIIQEACTNPGRMVGDLMAMPPEDLRQLGEWNSARPPDIRACIHNLIESNFLARPGMLAITAWDGDFTYQELDELSSRLSTHLMGLGVAVDTYIPVVFEKSRWVIVAIMGILRVGAAFVLVDPEQPSKRMRDIVARTGAELALASEALTPLALGFVQNIVTVSEATYNLEATTNRVDSGVRPHNAAYAVFTSGTTGVPKGVVIEHASYCTAAMGLQASLHIDENTMAFQFASFAFDVSISDILTTLIAGGCICMPSDYDRLNNLATSMQNFGVNWVHITPSVLRLLSPDDLTNVQTIVVSGEPMVSADVTLWASHVRLINAYGPAECSVDCSVQANISKDSDPRDVGFAVGGACWIVDPQNYECLLPIGGVGELLIEGTIVGRGYLNEPAKTKESFVQDPQWLLHFRSQSSGNRFYKTGDLVQYTPTGSMRFLGRKDTQIKLHGQRIELSEVELNVRASFSGAQDVVVELCNQGRSGFFLPATDEFRRQVFQVRAHIQGVLPQIMSPAMYLPLSQVPLTVSGKVNRRLLRGEFSKLSRNEQEAYDFVEVDGQGGLSTEERALQHRVAIVLGRRPEEIAMSKSFMVLGGDSITAMKLVAMSRKDGMVISVANVFRASTLLDLVACTVPQPVIGNQKSAEPFPCFVDEAQESEVLRLAMLFYRVAKDQIEDIYPCTALQEGLLLLTAKEDAEAYIAHFSFRLCRGVDISQLQKAWEAVVEANAILRTRVVHSDVSGSFQVVIRKSNKSPCVVLPKNPRMGFGTPLVYTTFKKGPEAEDYFFGLEIHHALYDEWSLPLLLGQLCSAYQNHPLPNHSFQPFVSYAQQQMEDAGYFWANRLKGFHGHVYPPLPSRNYKPMPSASLCHSIPMYRLRLKSRATLSTKLQLAWSVVQADYAGSPDIVYGLTVSGRRAAVAHIEQMTGPTIATIPVRFCLDPNELCADALDRIQNDAIMAVPFEQMGLQYIGKLGEAEAAACRFQTLFICGSAQETEYASDLLSDCVKSSAPHAFSMYALSIHCEETEEALTVTAKFDPELIPTSLMGRILESFEHVATMISAESSLPVSAIRSLSSAHESALAEWNRRVPEAVDFCVHDLIDRCFHETPDAPAVHAWDGTLTYHELDLHSVTLAAKLADIGIVPEDFVPLCFEKSVWAIVAVLAAMRAGGAFVLLDASFPPKRLQDICRQLRPKVVIVSSQNSGLAVGLAPRWICLGSDGPEPIISSTVDQIRDADDICTRSEPSGLEKPKPKPHHALYAVFTSGSTGSPKGAVVTHRAFATSATALSAAFGTSSQTRSFQFSSYAFDVSIADILVTLISGGCVCVPSDAQRQGDIAASIRALRSNWVHLTPSVVRLLSPSQIPSVKTLVLSGETMAKAEISTWAEQVNLIDAYGPAECSVDCCIRSPVKIGTNVADIGYATGCVLWIVDPDDDGRLVPIGAPGELLVEGPIVGREYLHDHVNTSAAFIPSPSWLATFRSQVSSAFYKTGDLVRYNTEDASIQFLGRKDAQIKLRGQRIELSDVEHHLRPAYPTARDVVADVLRPQNDAAAAMLVAFIDQGLNISAFDCDPSEFRCAVDIAKLSMREALPTYMNPVLYLPMASLPLTSNGKVDRQKLRAVTAGLTEEKMAAYVGKARQKVMPCNATEARLCAALATILNLSPSDISMDDDFFHLGADSIHAIKLVSLLRRRENLSTSVSDIFRHPRLYEIAAGLEIAKPDTIALQEGKSQSFLAGTDASRTMIAQLGLSAADIVDVLPATPFQSRCIRERPFTFFIMKFNRSLEEDVVLNACSTLVEKHEILRTIFVQQNEVDMVQVVLRETAVALGSYGDGAMGSEISCTEFCSRGLSERVPLGAPLVEFKLVKRPETQESILIFRISHAQYDGISMNIFFEDIISMLRGGPMYPSSSFRSYLYTSNERKTPAALSWWRRSLRGSSMTALQSLIGERIASQSASSGSLEKAISMPKLSSGLTAASLVRAAWGWTLARRSRTNDVVFGYLVNGRNTSGTCAVGPCINVVPARICFQEGWTAQDLLAYTQEQYTLSMPYETIAFEEIVQQCTEWAPGTQFSSVLQYQNIDEYPEFVTPDMRVTTSAVFAAPSTEHIMVSATPCQDRLLLGVAAPGLGINATDMSAILDVLCQAVENLSQRPDTLLTDLIAPGLGVSELLL